MSKTREEHRRDKWDRRGALTFTACILIGLWCPTWIDVVLGWCGQ